MGDSAHEMLSHHTSRKKKWKHNIQDIFDDELYKNHFNPKEYLHGTSAPARGMEIHLYLMVNTDGVSIFCSSNFSLWPVNFVITGLPPEKRCQIYIFFNAFNWTVYNSRGPEGMTTFKNWTSSQHGAIWNLAVVSNGHHPVTLVLGNLDYCTPTKYI